MNNKKTAKYMYYCINNSFVCVFSYFHKFNNE